MHKFLQALYTKIRTPWASYALVRFREDIEEDGEDQPDITEESGRALRSLRINHLLKKIRNPWASFGLIGTYRDTTDGGKTQRPEETGKSQTESKGRDNMISSRTTKTKKEERGKADPYWPSRMRRNINRTLLKRGGQNNLDRITKSRNDDNSLLKRADQNNLDRITKRRNDEISSVRDDDNSIFKEGLDNSMLKENYGDNIVQETDFDETFPNQVNCITFQVYKDENPLRNENYYDNKFQEDKKDKTDQEEKTDNTEQEREEDQYKYRYFPEEENSSFQDDKESN